MDDLGWLIKLLPEGASVTAVITVVILFLKHLTAQQAEHKDAVKDLTDTYNATQRAERLAFSTELKDTRDTFGLQLSHITEVLGEKHEVLQEKIVSLSENHIRVSTETLNALTGLKDAVHNLELRVKG